MKQSKKQKTLGNFISFILAIGLVATSLDAYVQADPAPETEGISTQTTALVEQSSDWTESGETTAALVTELTSEETQPTESLSGTSAATAPLAETETTLTAAETEPAETFAEASQDTETVPAESETSENATESLTETAAESSPDPAGRETSATESETAETQASADLQPAADPAVTVTPEPEVSVPAIEAETNPDHLSGPVTLLTPEIVRITAPLLNAAARLANRSGLEPGAVSVSKTAAPVTGKVNTWDITLTVSGRDTQKTSDIILVLDRSGSMAGSKMTAAKEAAKNFVHSLLAEGNSLNKIGLVDFGANVQSISLTNNETVLNNRIDSLSASGGTFTQLALKEAADLLAGSQADYQHIILLSDGLPTYSSKLNNPTSYLIPYDSSQETSSSAPASAYDYNVSVGSGNSLRTYVNNFGGTSYYYNHGNSAIAEAGFAKADGYEVWTIGFEIDSDGQTVLQGIASPGNNKSADSSSLNQVMQEIAGSIHAAVKNGSVSDPIATGFSVMGTLVNSNASQGTVSYDSSLKTITWNLGDLTQPGGSDIKTATLTYRIEINQDILTAAPSETGGSDFFTNGTTTLNYTDINNTAASKSFDLPTVDPVLLRLNKSLTAADDSLMTDGRQFTIRVTGPDHYDQSYTVTPGTELVLTNLRDEGTYHVTETAVSGVPASGLTDYDTVIKVNGLVNSSFVVGQGIADPVIRVENKEKPLGQLTVKKIFNQSAAAINSRAALVSPSFLFKVTGPDNYEEIFELSAGEEKVLTGLAYGQYTVEETDAQGFVTSYADTQGELTDGIVQLTVDSKQQTVTVTNRPGTGDDKVTIIGQKIWENGPAASHVAVEMVLYRDEVIWEAAPDYEVSPASGTANAFTYTWQDLPKYSETGAEYVYSINEAAIPDGYNQTLSEDGLTVTNSYVIPTDAEATATKIWVNGPANHPTVWFRLYRQTTGGTAEIVPGAGLKELADGTTEVSWTGLEATDAAGNTYHFSVKEVDADGNDYTPEDYVKTENGLSVTNSYVIPTDAEATATKIWVDGPATHPTVWFQLYRQTDGGTAEIVPGAGLKELVNGTTEVSWTGLEATDINGNAYHFSVKEVDADGNDYTPEDYVKTENGLSVTNSYVIPGDASALATKIWVNGPANHPTVWFQLYRQTDGGAAEIVPGAGLKMLVNGTTEVSWIDLDATDAAGNTYHFSVKEVDADGNDYTPEDYVKTENGLSVTNSYVIPTDAEATATKIWVDGPDAHPTVWFQLYRQTAGGPAENVPGADLKTLADRTTEVSWTGLDATDINGNAYHFSVKEVDADGNDYTPENYVKTENGLTVTNSYVIPTNAEATATKTWVNGPAEHPTVWFQLYRQTAGGPAEIVPGADLKTLADRTTEVSWTGLDATDAAGNTYHFSVKEVDGDGNDYTPDNYVKTENGLSVTNSYVIPGDASAVATKIWVNGPAEHPTVWFQLYRQTADGTPEAVPGAELKILANGTTSVSWTGLDATDINGNAYRFSVKEVDAAGSDYTPDKYVKQEAGLAVTNSYVIPTDAEATATKIWVNGPENHPTIWFQLYRQTADGMPEVVPGAELKMLVNGITEVSWTGLDATDINGNAYHFSVKEVDAEGQDSTPENYVKTENGLTVTNSYVIPGDASAVATKIWVNGPAEHPTIWFQLYRQTTGGTPETVPGAELKILANGITEVSWTGLDATDINGNAYRFSVKEVDADGNDYTPENYIKTENGLTVTNSYIIPTLAEAIATKIWVDGPADHPTVWFKLYRQTDGGTPEVVPGAELKPLADGTTEVRWAGLEATDISGQAYRFSVKEVDADGNDYTPEDYVKTENGLSVTNSYVIPGDASALATKIWVNGPANHPTVWFQLYRQTADGTPEVVPEAEIKALADGTTSVSWTGLDATDISGNTYRFSAKEVDADGNDYTPEDYVKTETGLTVTNSYVIPTNAEAIATKIWIDGPATHPTVWFKLYRQTADSIPEVVPGAELKTLTDGTTEVSWTGLDATDINGNAYRFSVKEVDAAGNDYTPENYVKTENGLTVTNNYVLPGDASAVATKIWVNGPVAHPTIWFRLYRQTADSAPEVVPEAEIKELTDGTTSVSWAGLDATDAAGNAYRFSVKEVDADGKDATPANYAKTETGLTVTNSYVIPADAAAAATKIWVDGPADHPTVWFKLYRQTADGTPEVVPGAALKELVNGSTEVSWTGLDATDINGNAYRFSVKEVDADGNDATPENYVKTENGLTVTNTYVDPLTVSAKATKKWVNTAGTHPTIWFKLYRQAGTAEPEAVPDAPITELPDGMTEVVWTGLPENDPAGQPYTYSVREVDAKGNRLQLENFQTEENGLMVINTYVKPVEVPKTGSSATPLPVIGWGLLLSGAALTLLQLRRRHNKQKREKPDKT
ncbi:Cna B-type domain-containing protein [Oscillospiraceae bacterium HV4-5-C5C]|nr:Cna B-type domain-containing protein [Oscillospiraceae bacterium HV4-5-C5C]